jgi:hypothetical protein
MVFLYPSDPLNAKLPDESFAGEFDAARTAGLQCRLFALEDFERGSLRIRPALPETSTVVYRGWMLKPSVFADLSDRLAAMGAKTLTTAHQYALCHHLPNWYPLITEFTAGTRTFPNDSALVASATALKWDGYFVKDYVKSLNTARGSIAQTAEEIPEILADIERFRGEVEGGVCLRRVEQYVPGSERRYFVVQGTPYADKNEAMPEAVTLCAQRIDHPFYAVDVAKNRGGVDRIIEIGEGQVSDRKHWDLEAFVALLKILSQAL